MCEMMRNSTFEEKLSELNDKDQHIILNRLFQLADDADVDKAGGLDVGVARMKRMPEGLKEVRKKRIGRHRVYYTGFHTECSYKSFYIKTYKKKGKDDEDNTNFQVKLFSALQTKPYEILPKLDDDDDNNDGQELN